MPRIFHLARKPLNGHPVWLSYLQSRHGYESKVCLVTHRETARRPYNTDLKFTDQKSLHNWAKVCNVLHLHDDMTLEDMTVRQLVRLLPENSIVIQQYYRPLSSLAKNLQRTTQAANEFPCMTMRSAALATPEMPCVPIVIPIWFNEMKPVYQNRTKPRLVWTPTGVVKLGVKDIHGKGYAQTKPVLDRLSSKLDVEIISDLNWKETMVKKQHADFALDELVTGGYGMTALEGLAHGNIVISGAKPDVVAMLPKQFPFFHATVDTLEETIDQLLAMPFTVRKDLAQMGRKWIEEWYNEKYLFISYEELYTDAFKKAYGSTQGFEARYKQKGTVKVPSITFPRESGGKRIPAVLKPAQKATQKFDRKSPNEALIVQISRTNCAGAIWRLHDAINKYTPHRCRTITQSPTTNGRRYPQDVLFHQSGNVRQLIKQADVIHFHNYADPADRQFRQFANEMARKKVVIQYHTHPDQMRGALRQDPSKRTDYPVLIIAQKHARFYPNAIPVPNLIDTDAVLMQPSTREYAGGPLRLIYSPTDLISYPNYTKICAGKGVPECSPILQRLHRKGVILLNHITNKPWDSLMKIKRDNDVCLDEVMTGGYHLCSLEALSQGLATVAWLDQQTQEIIHQIVGERTELPWLNTQFSDLESTLTDLHSHAKDRLPKIKRESREWMLSYWHPAKLVAHYLRAYKLMDGEAPKPYQPVVRFRDVPLLDVYKKPPSIQDDLRNLRDSWRGKQVVIWGNGPSAREALEEKPWNVNAQHIGTNAAFKLRKDFGAYCVGDFRFFEDASNKSAVLGLDTVRVFQSHLRSVLPKGVNCNYVKALGRDGFSSDLSEGIFYGLSVVYLAIQTAVWAGAQEILLVGCEHDYTNGRFYAEKNPMPNDERNMPLILKNYQDLLPVLRKMGVKLETFGASRLQQAGVPQAKNGAKA